jgi:glycosyltransferase involved in cell wall biosynthesis
VFDDADCAVVMRIAHVVAQRATAPLSGYAMRTWALSTALADLGELTVVNVRPAEPGVPPSDEITLGDGRTARYDEVATNVFASWSAERTFDVVVADETALAPTVRARSDARRIVSCHNVESVLARAQATHAPVESRAAHARRAESFELLERRVFPDFDQVWAVSGSDADALRALVPGLDVRVVPNVVAVPAPSVRKPQPGHCTWFGSLWYEPNQDAVVNLLAVSEELDRRGVAHRLTIAGKGAPSWLTDRIGQRAAATAPGFVDDLPALLARSAAAVFPMSYGGGSMVKLLEALALGCPAVTTPEGARGIPELRDGEDALIRPLGPAFVDAVADLLAEPGKYDALGRAGARLVHDGYSLPVLDALLAELLGGAAG